MQQGSQSQQELQEHGSTGHAGHGAAWQGHGVITVYFGNGQGQGWEQGHAAKLDWAPTANNTKVPKVNNAFFMVDFSFSVLVVALLFSD